MDVRIVVQNLGLGALRNGNGDPEDRWPALAERILSTGPPDFVCLQEALGWGEFGHRQLARASYDLDMDPLPLPPSSSGIVPALFYRRETLGRWTHWNTDFADQTLHGFGAAVFDVGLPAPLTVISAHLDPFVPDRARHEAKLLATRALRYGPYGIVAGDINYPPADPKHPAPDYVEMRPYNRAARTRLPSESGGRITPERRIAETLSYTGFVDAAWELYERTGDETLLRRTCADERIDQLWASAPLRDAITDYQLLNSPPEASDHHGLAVVLDLARAATDNVWEYR
ncbi:endonuclease/exonuclease/phosphatase family protein [Streptomyces sp. SS162]|uniref:endonuclease/exonuclease/phosphatase family protein n=1 Tax=Streptomyces sp. SS162 TaxID=3108484 RepID=UPI002F422E74